MNQIKMNGVLFLSQNRGVGEEFNGVAREKIL